MPRDEGQKPKPKPPQLQAPEDASGFAVVPEALSVLAYQRHLSGTEIVVLLLLMGRQRRPNEFSRPAQDIADLTGMHPNTVTNALSSLVSKGILSRRSRGYRGRTAVYAIAVKGKSLTDWLGKSIEESKAESGE